MEFASRTPIGALCIQLKGSLIPMKWLYGTNTAPPISTSIVALKGFGVGGEAVVVEAPNCKVTRGLAVGDGVGTGEVL